MRLEGTLDAFSLPDIFQLLSYTKKTGTLHLRREGAHGAVHLRDGAVTGARADVRRQALGRRLVGCGLVDDETLASAVEALVDTPEGGLGRVLVERAGLDADTVRAVAVEQATDAVFDLLRWPDGEFAFVVDEDGPDDLGTALPVDQVVEEGRRRLEAWAALTAAVPAPDAVVTVVLSPSAPPALSTEEWQLLALVDGRRTVADLVQLAGRGHFAVVGALAALVERGLLEVRASVAGDGTTALLRRQQLLAALEGLPVDGGPVDAAPVEAAPVEAAPVGAAPVTGARPGAPAVPAVADVVPAQAEPAPVLPARPEPFTPARRPDHPEQAPTYARSGLPTSVGAVDGATALAPEPGVATAVAPGVERDPNINKSLLLRLIAGVRGL